MRDFYASAPDAAGVALAHVRSPPAPFVPEEWQGRLVAAIAGMWSGPVEEGGAACASSSRARGRSSNVFGEMPYTELQRMIDDPPGLRNWWTAEYLRTSRTRRCDAYCEYVERMPLSRRSPARPLGRRGGARERHAAHQPRRGWVVHPYGLWEEQSGTTSTSPGARVARRVRDRVAPVGRT